MGKPAGRLILDAIASAALLIMPASISPAFAQVPAQQAEAWKPESFELANGLKVVVLPDHRAPVVTHMMWYRVGAADEVKGKSGLAHFLEHLMFKATDKIAAGEYSKIIARNGGQDNASTTSDYTNYFFRIARDRLSEMMQMEADRMVGLKLEKAEVESELKVVQSERRQNVDSEPGSLLYEKMAAAMYPGHPYGVPVIGHMNEVEKLTQEDAQDWYHRWYGPENAILVVAGDITAAELKPMVEKTFGVIPKRGDLTQRAWPDVKPIAKSVELSHSDPKVRQPSWMRHWLGVKVGDPDAEALQVGMTILGGGRTSRLYRELVEKGVAVMAGAYSSESAARGVIGLSASPTPGVSMAQVEKAALAVTNRFLKEGPTAEEMTRAKKMMIAAEVFARDNQMGMVDWYGSQLVTGQSVEWIMAEDSRINAVTTEQVMAAMKKYLVGVNHIDGVLLPEATR